jgi:hypothetical protein
MDKNLFTRLGTSSVVRLWDFPEQENSTSIAKSVASSRFTMLLSGFWFYFKNVLGTLFHKTTVAGNVNRKIRGKSRTAPGAV